MSTVMGGEGTVQRSRVKASGTSSREGVSAVKQDLGLSRLPGPF